MKRQIIIVVSLILMVVVATIGILCLKPFNKDIWDINANNLRHAFQPISGDAVIDDLSQWTSFDWDTIYSFRPYTTKEGIYITVGYNWDDINETVNEGMNQIVFMNKGKVVCYLYGYAENLGIGFNFGYHEGSHIKLTSKKPLRFKSTISKNEKVRYFEYIK